MWPSADHFVKLWTQTSETPQE